MHVGNDKYWEVNVETVSVVILSHVRIFCCNATT